MYSTRCTHCQQIITLKGEEIQAAITEAESAGRPNYEMKCPRCRKPVKIQVKMLRLKLPRDIPESLDGRAAGAEAADAEAAPADEPAEETDEASATGTRRSKRRG
jgi:hypothetical protein